jgi:hypothetical protein
MKAELTLPDFRRTLAVMASRKKQLSREEIHALRGNPWLRKNVWRFHQGEAFGSDVPDSQSREQGHGDCAGKIIPTAWHHRLAEASQTAGDGWQVACDKKSTRVRPVTCHTSPVTRRPPRFRF